MPMDDGEGEVAEVVHDHKKDIGEVGPEDVLRPTVMDNIVPASPEVV